MTGVGGNHETNRLVRAPWLQHPDSKLNGNSEIFSAMAVASARVPLIKAYVNRRRSKNRDETREQPNGIDYAGRQHRDRLQRLARLRLCISGEF